MTRMRVYKVGLDLQRQPLVLLADEAEQRFLPIWIGPFEAHAIATHLQGQEFARPLTHDLLLSVIAAFGGQLTEVHVTHIEDHVFYALLIIKGPQGLMEIDSRPSDAIALAVRAGAEIFVAETVLEELQILSPDGEAVELDRLRNLLSGLDLGPEEPPEGTEPEELDEE
ncbi:MAG: bifunctional nuclease family protein [Armatimonadetes bacterium]|nr:bifunctional nuclease family protein [Armatimonadota bacterium]